MTLTESARVIAFHQTAHAIVNYRAARYVGGAISILPRPDEGILGTAEDGESDSFNADDMVSRVLSCYAGGHAQRILDPHNGEEGCGEDDEIAAQLLAKCGWQRREQELRQRSLELVQQHWGEIILVAEELLRAKTLDDEEVAILADAAADLAEYRALRELAEEKEGKARR
jgi:hypothetical protein